MRLIDDYATKSKSKFLIGSFFSFLRFVFQFSPTPPVLGSRELYVLKPRLFLYTLKARHGHHGGKHSATCVHRPLLLLLLLRPAPTLISVWSGRFPFARLLRIYTTRVSHDKSLCIDHQFFFSLLISIPCLYKCPPVSCWDMCVESNINIYKKNIHHRMDDGSDQDANL